MPAPRPPRPPGRPPHELLPAREQDHAVLTVITQASKAHWGYSPEQMKQWEEELTIRPAYIRENRVTKLVVLGEAIGYASCLDLREGQRKLDNLFVLPDRMGKGWGSILLEAVIAEARSAGVRRLTLDADPHAEGFYLRHGFRVVGQLPSSIPGRTLPIMELEL